MSGKITNKRRKELEQLESKDTKYCPMCKKIKSLSEFFVCSAGRKLAGTYCIECAEEKRILKKYNITIKEYDKLLKKQGKGCAICGTKIPGGTGRFAIDHEHLTGKIRGLLCVNCNNGLGNFRDDPETLITAAQYLMKQNKEEK